MPKEEAFGHGEQSSLVGEQDEEETNRRVGVPSLAATYTARLSNEADYARYRAAKLSAVSNESFARLATLHALQSAYGYYHLLYQQQQLQQQQQQQHQQSRLQHAKSPLSSPISNASLLSPTASSLDTSSASPTRPIVREASSSDEGPSPKRSRRGPAPGSRGRGKAQRRLAFDDYKTSPVSGTIIRELAEGEEIVPIRKGDIDPEFNVVEVTEEARAELAKIENRIGDFICRLCKEIYDDAFGLAQHR